MVHIISCIIIRRRRAGTRSSQDRPAGKVIDNGKIINIRVRGINGINGHISCAGNRQGRIREVDSFVGRFNDTVSGVFRRQIGAGSVLIREYKIGFVNANRAVRCCRSKSQHVPIARYGPADIELPGDCGGNSRGVIAIGQGDRGAGKCKRIRPGHRHGIFKIQFYKGTGSADIGENKVRAQYRHITGSIVGKGNNGGSQSVRCCPVGTELIAGHHNIKIHRSNGRSNIRSRPGRRPNRRTIKREAIRTIKNQPVNQIQGESFKLRHRGKDEFTNVQRSIGNNVDGHQVIIDTAGYCNNIRHRVDAAGNVIALGQWIPVGNNG